MRPGIVVACEGETEKAFLDGLRQRYRLSTAHVVLLGKVGDPLAVVRKAVETRKERVRGLRSQRIRAFAVFDRDEHPRFSSALQHARDADVETAVSNPCVELWFIWMVEDCTAPLHRTDAQRRCKALHRGYCHDSRPYVDVPTDVERAVKEAQRRADTAARRHRCAGDPDHHNPSSTFGSVVEALLGLLPDGRPP